jgi:hypothetical protein
MVKSVELELLRQHKAVLAIGRSYIESEALVRPMEGSCKAADSDVDLVLDDDHSSGALLLRRQRLSLGPSSKWKSLSCQSWHRL